MIVFIIMLSLLISFPIVVSSVHQGVYGYIEYSDGSWVPNGIPVNITDENNGNSMVVYTATADSGHTGFYIIDVIDIDGEGDDKINVSVSYGGCIGNNSVIIISGAPPQRCNVTICCNLPPNASSQPTGDTSGYHSISYTYSTSTTDPNGDSIYYWFDWGDQTNSGWMGPYASGATASHSHSWNTPGSYNVKCKAKDIYEAEKGLAWSDPVTVTISNPPGTPENEAPTADFTYTPATPSVNDTVTFTDASTDDGTIVNWSWDFGDGTNSSEQNPSYVYTEAGDYMVTLNVTDNENVTDNIQKTISVSSTPSPLTNASWQETTEITLEYNEKNQGINYLAWKGETINASMLAEKASLSNGDTISVFSKTNGEWLMHVVGESDQTDDFLISPWDVISIRCTSKKTIVLDISKQNDTTQSVVINFTSESGTKKSNNGYNFFAWSKKQTINVKDFTVIYDFSNDDVGISLYDSDSNEWITYNPSLPAVFQKQFTVQHYDIICIKVAKDSQEHILTIT